MPVRFGRLRGAAALIVVLLGSDAILSATTVGPLFSVSSIRGKWEIGPKCSYNPIAQHFFVPWLYIDPSQFNGEVYATNVRSNFVNLNQTKSPPKVLTFPLSQFKGGTFDVAYNSQKNEYLLVWLEKGTILWGEIVDANANVISRRKLQDHFGFSTELNLVFHPVLNEYLLANDTSSSFYRVSSDGTAVRTAFTMPQYAVGLTALPSSTDGSYFVFWKYLHSTFFSRVIPNGGISPVRLLDATVQSATSGPVSVILGTNWSEFLLAFDGRVSGSQAQAPFRVARFGLTGKRIGPLITIAQKDHIEVEPALALSKNGYLVAYTRSYALYLRKLDSQGNPVGNEQTLYSGPDLAYYPRIASNTLRSKFLVVWNTEYEVDTLARFLFDP